MSTLNFIGEFPILRHALDLGEYHPDLEGNSVEVWLNLSDDFQERWRAYNDELKALAESKPDANLPRKLKTRRAELFAELWNLDVADTVALFDKTEAAGLRAWMRRRTWETIEEYATGRGEAVGG
jgi:hypothetical protein